MCAGFAIGALFLFVTTQAVDYAERDTNQERNVEMIGQESKSTTVFNVPLKEGVPMTKAEKDKLSIHFFLLWFMSSALVGVADIARGANRCAQALEKKSAD
jgi:hypothetical protein